MERVQEDTESCFPFLFDNNKLERHLQLVKAGENPKPSAEELIKSFLKLSQNSSAQKSQLVRSLACKVAQSLDLSLEEIERTLPFKFQKSLLQDLCSLPNSSVTHKLNYHRWVLRRILKLGETKKSSKATVEQELEQEAQVAVHFLQSWLKEGSDPRKEHYSFQINMELGEYLFHAENFREAREHLRAIAKRAPVGGDNQSPLRLQSLLDACNTLLGDSAMETPSVVLRAERWVAEGNLRGIVELLTEDTLAHVKSMLRRDLGRPSEHLSVNYRCLFESRRELSPVRVQVCTCNAILKAIRGEYGGPSSYFHSIQLYPSSEPFVQAVEFLFGTSTSTFQRIEQVCSAEGDNEVRDRLFGLIQQLVRTIAVSSNSPVVRQLFLRHAGRFAVLPEDESALRALEAVGTAQVEPMSIETSFAWRAADPQQLFEHIQRAKKEQSDFDLEAAVLGNANRLLQMGFPEEATKLLSLMSPSAGGYSRLSVELSVENVSHQVPEVFFSLLSKNGPPPLAPLQEIFKCLIKGSEWDALTRYCTELQRVIHAFKEIAPLHKCLVLSEIAATLVEFTQLCRHHLSSIDAMSVEGKKESGQAIEGAFERLLGFFIASEKSPKPSFGWSEVAPIISNEEVLRNLVSLLVGALYHIRKIKKSVSSNDPALDRYGPLAQLAGGSSFFTSSALVTVEKEPSLLEMFASSVQVLSKRAPDESKWLYAIGDLKFEEADLLRSKDPSKFRHCIRHYLQAGAQETGYFSINSKIPKTFHGIIRRLIAALSAIKADVQACVLCQFLPNVDYGLAFKMIEENASQLDPTYFQYMWDLPILELLLFHFSKGRDNAKQSLVAHLIGRPELNENNPPQTREMIVDHIKMNFLKKLTRDFLI